MAFGNRKFHHLMLRASLTALTAACATPALAQDNADPSAEQAPADDEIVVTGLRASLQSAQNIKRNSEQFVDSITAQDIGRLPDVNVAESLQRISGVQITRNRGEGSGIAVRGLTQVRTELNGRDIFQASGGRGLSWEEVGSELLAGIDVYKNPSAELIEGGLSGTVNLRTRKPFDSSGRIIALNAGATYFDLIEQSGQQLAGLYSNRWDTGIGEIGLLFNVGYQTTAFREDKVVVEPFWRHGPNPTNISSIKQAYPGFENQTLLAPHGGGFAVSYGDRERLSGTAVLQWKPTDRLELYAQYFRADYSFDEAGVSFFAYGEDMPIATGPNRPFTVDDEGVVRSGYFSNPGVDSVNYGTLRDTSTSEYSGGLIWQATDRLKLSVDYQHIDSDVQQQTLNLTASALNPRTSVAGLGKAYDFFFDISGDVPVLLATDPSYYGDIRNYGMTAILPYAEDNEAAADAIRADLSWDFDDGSFIQQIRVGGRYTDKSAINRNTTYGTWTAIGSTCANWSSVDGCTLLSEFPQYAEPNRFQSNLLRGRASDTVFGPVWQFSDALINDSAAAFAAVKAISGQDIAFRPFDAPNAFSGTIDEKTYAGYVRVAFGADLGGIRFDGNAGLRAVRTETAANGLSVLTYRDPASSGTTPTTVTVTEPYSGGRDYDKYLPSLNLRVFLTDELILRAAASKNFSRPAFTSLNPSFTLSPNYTDVGENRALTPDRVNNNLPYDPVTNPYAGNGTAQGNPDLLPEEVTQADLALEWYFEPVGYVYATGFYKKIKNLITTEAATFVREIAGVGNVQFGVTNLVNVEEGFVRGFEVGGQKFFNFLPAPFDGLGVQANYTYVESDAGQQAAGAIGSPELIRVPITNLSKHSFNLVGLYDKDGLNIRVAYNWRDDYLQGTANTGTQNLPIYGEAFGVLDASVSYDVTPQFSIIVDGQNLLDTAFKTYQIVGSRPRDYVINDRRFSIRTRVRF